MFSIGSAALFLLGTLLAVGLLVTGHSADRASSISAAVILPFVAVLCRLVGRGLRYILAGK
jgi:hypothetical protein